MAHLPLRWRVARHRQCTINNGKPEGVLIAEKQKEFEKTTTLFVGWIRSVLIDRLVERSFGTALKHKRQEYSVEGFIASLDVEEKAQEKDVASKGNDGQSNANVVHKAQNKNKEKYKPQQTINFKHQKKKNITTI
uniref:Pol polyprotein n=2 Tax=Oryza sativa subsp. japonica TaxID=39947 RepID=A0A5S6R762_ORYSJ|nr:Putative pol polyprotein [Oryza sativa Japonica Group]AAM08634.1 Hypothetical protein with similarity to putative retroelement [Oryza sativa Japonica Group]AAP51747.1 retrotransposon protein, putative, Ty1-copia subclass [Oryza sativa Japonica Group]